MNFAIFFLVIFLGGPLFFRLLTRHDPTPENLRFLALFTGVTALGGLAIRFGLPDLWAANVITTASAVMLAWFGWIGVLAYGAQALRRYDPRPNMRRWTAILGAIGTTIPWFGLAWATMVAG